MPKEKPKFLTVGVMTVMLITTIISLRGLASQAEYGLTSIFYYVFAALVFLVPYSFVCAELASMYPQSGGVFRWVGEAFGQRWGWVAMYLDWLMIVAWFPAVLMFGAVSVAYIFWPETFDASLASNRLYTILMVLGVYWLAMVVTFRGTGAANRLSTYGGLFGTIIPAAILIVLAVIYLLRGEPMYLPLDKPFWPDFSHFDNIVLAASIFIFFAGMELQAPHIPNMNRPSSFPKAVFMATGVIVVIFVLATLAIGVTVPEKDINLLQSLLVTFKKLWASLGLGWVGNIMAVLVAFGVLGQVTVNAFGPALGLKAVGNAGCLPRVLQKENKHGIPTSILFVQGGIVSVLSLALVLLPSVQSAYQLMSQLATVLYLVMVVIVYITVIALRRTAPNASRPAKIPGGKVGLWVVCSVGILGALVAMALSFLPPDQINVGSPAVYIGILVACVAIFLIIPFVVYARKKPSWKNPAIKFYPFTWQIEHRRPTAISRWPKGYVPSPREIQDAEQAET